MARLRVRIELNQRIAGVPLEKMASVVEETRKFFYLLSEDVQIQADRGEWRASDFDAESLNFTAEYAGPVSAEQAHAFGAAFAGATSLRRATIAQFTPHRRISGRRRISRIWSLSIRPGAGAHRMALSLQARCLAVWRRDQAARRSGRGPTARNPVAGRDERKRGGTPAVQRPPGARNAGGRSVQIDSRTGIQFIAPDDGARRRSGRANRAGAEAERQSGSGRRALPETAVRHGDVLGASAAPVPAVAAARAAHRRGSRYRAGSKNAAPRATRVDRAGRDRSFGHRDYCRSRFSRATASMDAFLQRSKYCR